MICVRNGKTPKQIGHGLTICRCVQRQGQDLLQIQFTGETQVFPIQSNLIENDFREDGARQEGTYRSRDRSFYCRIDENTDIYAIFSGFSEKLKCVP